MKSFFKAASESVIAIKTVKLTYYTSLLHLLIRHPLALAIDVHHHLPITIKWKLQNQMLHNTSSKKNRIKRDKIIRWVFTNGYQIHWYNLWTSVGSFWYLYWLWPDFTPYSRGSIVKEVKEDSSYITVNGKPRKFKNFWKMIGYMFDNYPVKFAFKLLIVLQFLLSSLLLNKMLLSSNRQTILFHIHIKGNPLLSFHICITVPLKEK